MQKTLQAFISHAKKFSVRIQTSHENISIWNIEKEKISKEGFFKNHFFITKRTNQFENLPSCKKATKSRVSENFEKKSMWYHEKFYQGRKNLV